MVSKGISLSDLTSLSWNPTKEEEEHVCIAYLEEMLNPTCNPLKNCHLSKLRTLWKVLHTRNVSNVNDQQEIRVRFAPSPTGHIHLGGLRTALYNYLFAKSCKGKFILRIEDTDQSRIVQGAVSKLEDDLIWAGIHPDESPRQGGSFGPYMQSERLPLYKEQVDHLLSSGTAYRCFCSDRRLDLLRREALRARQVPRYDNKCRHLSPSEVNEKLDRSKVHCIRFKLSSAEEFHDQIYGRISPDISHQEGDPVILKSDGFPTYHLANVVDDQAMRISHVLRGVEWQISTQKHIQLYRAFGWQPPVFAHLPLILNADGSKLSKRQGDVHMEHYQAEGIFPLALLNYVTNAGGGFKRHTVKPCSFTLQELVDQFDMSLINVNSCRLMPDRLLQFNSLELERLLTDEAQVKQLVKQVKELVISNFENKLENSELQLQDQHIRSVLFWSVKRITRLSDLVNKDLAFLWILPDSESIKMKDFNVDILEALKESLQQISDSVFKPDDLKSTLKIFCSNNDVPFNKLMKSLRYGLSGLKEGPGVAEMMSILGQNSTIARLDRIIAWSKK